MAQRMQNKLESLTQNILLFGVLFGYATHSLFSYFASVAPNSLSLFFVDVLNIKRTLMMKTKEEKKNVQEKP